MNPLLTFENILYEAGILVSLLLSAFFSGTETAILSSSRNKLVTLAAKGQRNSKKALNILDGKEDAIVMLLIWNNIVTISSASFIIFIAKNSFAMRPSQLPAIIAVQTIIWLILGEITPKIITRVHPENFLLLFSGPLSLLIKIIKPAAAFAVFFAGLVKRLFRVHEAAGKSLLISREEIAHLFMLGGKEGIIGSENQIYVSEILSFKEVTASEIRTPTIDIVSVDIRQELSELVEIIVRTKFSRIPVYRDKPHNIIGYVFYRDILDTGHTRNISELLIKAHYVPATKKIPELYLEMLENVIPMVFVVNEYGGVTGLVTHEDIAEEIVGEIQARDQSEDDLMTKISDRKYLIAGDFNIDYFQRIFPVRIKKKGFETVAGFMMHRMGKIPKKGDQLEYDRHTFIVEEATERSIDKIMLILPVRKKIRKK